MKQETIGSVAKQLVELAIMQGTPSERKERILIAREEGVFTDQEAADWLRILDVEAA